MKNESQETHPGDQGRVARCVGSESNRVRVVYFPEANVYLVAGYRCRSQWHAERTVWDLQDCTFKEAREIVELARMDGFRDLRDIQAVARA